MLGLFDQDSPDKIECADFGILVVPYNNLSVGFMIRPPVYKTFLCSAQLRLKFKLLIRTEID